MNDFSKHFPTIDALKTQARALRKLLGEAGNVVSHAQTLELVAKQWGAKDWNTAVALSKNAHQRRDYQVGQRVRGRYLGYPFTAQIKAAGKMGANMRLSLALDTPIDVVRFEGFSSFRRRINCTINQAGRTIEHTSDGTPHVVILS